MESLIVPGLIVIVGVLMGISWNNLGKRIDDGNKAHAKSIDKVEKSIDKVDSKIDRIQSDIKELHGEVQFIKGRLDPYESPAE